MRVVPHPEVLSPDWVPPVPLVHRRELEDVVRWLGEPYPSRAPPWAACVVGPRGSGTSTVARLAARRVLDSLRRDGIGRTPRILSVRVREQRGSHGVASALLQQLHPEFDGRGFPTAQMLAGVLRRLHREGSPAIVVLDDIGKGSGFLGGVLSAFLRPDRFLPEGVQPGPPLWLILAGVPEALDVWTRAEPPGADRAGCWKWEALTVSEVERILLDRLWRARGSVAVAASVTPLAEHAVASGFGGTRAIESLRSELLGPQSPAQTRRGRTAPRVAIEPHVVRAIEEATVQGAVSLRKLRAWERHLARLEGRRTLPTTTLWRRLVQLESEGYLRRDVRVGGPGGTQSLILVVRPLEDLSSASVRSLPVSDGPPLPDPREWEPG